MGIFGYYGLSGSGRVDIVVVSVCCRWVWASPIVVSARPVVCDGQFYVLFVVCDLVGRVVYGVLWLGPVKLVDTSSVYLIVLDLKPVLVVDRPAFVQLGEFVDAYYLASFSVGYWPNPPGAELVQLTLLIFIQCST